ncbi:MAG: hypothetical protein ACFCU1_07065 [Sumerlaeia bacterium]
MMIKNLFPPTVLLPFFTALFAAVLLTACAKNPYSAGTLQVVLQNNSDTVVQNVNVYHGTNSFGVPTLQPGEKVTTRFTLQNPLEMQFLYSTVEEGPVTEEFPLPTRTTDGGEVVLQFNQDQSVTRISRFDVY